MGRVFSLEEAKQLTLRVRSLTAPVTQLAESMAKELQRAENQGQLALAEDLKKRRVQLRIDNLGIDITTPAGEMVFTMMAGMAKMERELMLERQRIGIEKAKAEGKYTGRKALDPVVVETAKKLVAEGMAKPAVAKQLKMGLSTLYKYLAA